MGARNAAPHPPLGHDILARYLHAYANARQLSDVERPWGLGSDGLDAVWARLTQALADDPERLTQLIAEELSDQDREHIVQTLAPLLFAMPLRAYPSELRALVHGPRLLLSMRHFAMSRPPKLPEKSPQHALPGAKNAPLGKVAKAHKKGGNDEPIGYLPASLMSAFAGYLREVLSLHASKQRRNVTVSSGGRRRRVRVTMLTRQRGILIRFLERLPSPMDEAV